MVVTSRRRYRQSPQVRPGPLGADLPRRVRGVRTGA